MLEISFEPNHRRLFVNCDRVEKGPAAQFEDLHVARLFDTDKSSLRAGATMITEDERRYREPALARRIVGEGLGLDFPLPGRSRRQTAPSMPLATASSLRQCVTATREYVFPVYRVGLPIRQRRIRDDAREGPCGFPRI